MDFQFSPEARRHFDSVSQRFNLVCVLANEREVRYENENVFLKVCFDNGRSYELGVNIGKKKGRYAGSWISLAEILRLRGAQDPVSAYAVMVDDQGRLSDAVAWLAELTSTYASDFLLGSDLSFAQAAQLRNKEVAQFELDSQLRLAQLDAETAWHSRDYATVVKVFEPLQKHLTPAQKKLFNYSKKKIDL